MLFRVENLGPLREAEVDLAKSLIVLTGPNNTGKTYFAWSVYGLYNSTEDNQAVTSQRLVDELMNSASHEADPEQLTVEEWRAYYAEATATYRSVIHLCFATQAADFKGAEVIVSPGDPRRDLRAGTTGGYLMETVTGRPVQVRRTSKGASPLRLVSSPSALAALTPEDKKLVRDQLAIVIAVELAERAFGGCVLFPAERFAINIFARELSLKRSGLVDKLVDADLAGERDAPRALVRREAGRYPWPIRDSLRTASDLANLGKMKSDFEDLAQELEHAVLGGTIDISEHGEPTFAPQSTPGRHLAIHLTASVVKSLASLVFYFRHQAQPNDFLIIDEPELNLHPDNQRKVARILAKAVRRGFKIMLSTHSDHFVREVSHLIMLSKLPPDEARTMGFDPDAALEPDKVGVYLFDQHTAQPIPVEETGFSVKTIDDEINKLNDDAQRLYSRLFE